MRCYIISTLFHKLFVFGCITTQAFIIAEITEKTIINTYKIEVFDLSKKKKEIEVFG